MAVHGSVFRFRRCLLAAVIAGCGVGGLPVLAQDQRSGALEEVVVTAQRREESLQETPISITAFTAGTLQDMGVHDVTGIAEAAPNLQINETPGATASTGIYIRGVGISDAAIIFDPKVGMYLDGVYISKAIGSIFDVVELERIEVLRGPQGTLFGRNTTGGAINMTSRKPTGEFDARAKASVGNDGYYRYGFSTNLPEAYKLSAQLSGDVSSYDGWADNNYNGPSLSPGVNKLKGDPSSYDTWAYRLALRWRPHDSVTVDYDFDRNHRTAVASPFQLTGIGTSITTNGLNPVQVPFTYLGGPLFQQMAANVGDPQKRRDDFMLDGETEEHTDITAHTAIGEWQAAENLTLKYIFSYRFTDNGNTGNDLDGGVYYAPDLWYGSVPAGAFPPNGSAANFVQATAFEGMTPKNQIDARSHEVQALGKALDEKLTYTAGLYYSEETTQQDNPQTYSLPLENLLAIPQMAPMRGLYQAYGYCPTGVCIGTQRLPIPLASADPGIPGYVDFRYGQDASSWAAYAQATYSLTEALDLTFGLRYTEDEKDAWLQQQNIDADPNTPGTQFGRIKANDNWNNTSYMANASYQITDDLNAYLKYSTGYNAGGYNPRAANVTAFQTPFDEETVEVWELGLKSEWLDQRLRINASVFTNDYQDIQVNQFISGASGASSVVVNAGSGTYRGFELELVAVPVDGLTLDAAYGYLDAKYNDYDVQDPGNPGQKVDISDITKVAYVPDNSVTAGVQYDFQPFSFGALSVRVDGSYRSKIYFHPYDNAITPADSYSLLNARVSLNDIKLDALGRDGALRVSLWGKNLTDEEYRNFGIDFGALGFAGNRFGMPRTYGLDLVYDMK